MRLTVQRPAAALRGQVRVPGDKSLSHRAVLFASMSEGESRLEGVLDSADVRSTIEAVRALGAQVTVQTGGDGLGDPSATRENEDESALLLSVSGWGDKGPTRPVGSIDCGNSGTTARLLMGVLAGWPITATLVGDESLSKRPMLRVTRPLEQMGALFATTDGKLPVTVTGGDLRPIFYESPVASAQVKTAVLLAGLRADGRTTVREPSASRDHTERLLPAFGASAGGNPADHTAWVDGPATLEAADMKVPADPSSAAFIVAAALFVEGSRISLPGVSLNKTRTGFLRVLRRMGADVIVDPWQPYGSEPVGEIIATYSMGLKATTVSEDEVPSLIDEIPILALVATQAEGTTRFEHVGELRVKESDRLQAVTEGLTALGARVDSGPDWLEVHGPTPLGKADLDALGDHRLAMTWFVAGLISRGPVTINQFESVAVSYPNFVTAIEGLAAQ